MWSTRVCGNLKSNLFLRNQQLLKTGHARKPHHRASLAVIERTDQRRGQCGNAPYPHRDCVASSLPSACTFSRIDIRSAGLLRSN